MFDTFALRAMSVKSPWQNTQCKHFACCAYAIDSDQHEFKTFVLHAMSVKSLWNNAQGRPLHAEHMSIVGAMCV